MRWFDFVLTNWKSILLAVVLFDILVVGAILYLFSAPETSRVEAAELAQIDISPTVTATATPWPGPPPTVTRTPTLPPTPNPTGVLAESGFPVGFTPTPRPTPEQVTITLPRIYPVYRNNLDVPVINQIHYPEPFFPPGTNNACGPVALFSGLRALGMNIDYIRLRNYAVGYGFTSYGISKSGMIHTLNAINSEQGNPLLIEYGDRYSSKDLIRHIRTGGVVIVLINVRREQGRFVVTADKTNSFGHFLIVDSINLRSNTVNFAGSTLGMEKVPLRDFLQSWGGNNQVTMQSKRGYLSLPKQEAGKNWAIIIRRRP